MKTRITMNELPLRAAKLNDGELEGVFGGACTGCGCGSSCDCIPGDSCVNGICVKNETSPYNQPTTYSSGTMSALLY